MALSMSVWRVHEKKLEPIGESRLATEEQLEEWIAHDPSILGLEILIIGRQVTTFSGGRVDLLAIDAKADVLVLELKRDRTPRDVVAQALDYGSWARRLTYGDLNGIASDYLGKELAAAYKETFDQSMPENVNVNHGMVIVASELDSSSERIVEYLADEYEVGINVIFFKVFEDSSGQLLGRAWLMDPQDVQERAGARRQAPWTGYWFVNVGEGEHRNWEDNVKYGYIGAGQGPKYSTPLKKLKEGDPIFAYMKGLGYVGYGVVVEEAKMLQDFTVGSAGESLLDVPLIASNASENSQDPELSDWAVRVDWKSTFSRSDARYFKGLFANQNIVCKLRHAPTIEFLESEFGASSQSVA
ncbi:hypothetical protein ACFLSF_01160 [Candidatus Bipolaricaulota bacterium]